MSVELKEIENIIKIATNSKERRLKVFEANINYYDVKPTEWGLRERTGAKELLGDTLRDYADMLAVILSRDYVESDPDMKDRIEVSLREAETQISQSHTKWFEVRNRKEQQREAERATKEPKYRRREEEEEEEDDDKSVSPKGRQRTLKLTYNELRPEAAHKKLTQM
jgi:hypothetical protein